MKLGLQINRFDYHPGSDTIRDDLTGIAQSAESAGFDSLWVMDHFFQLPILGNPDEPMMEAYTTLGFLAGVTERVMLGTMVAGVIYREPALLINAVTALDVLSGGRAYFGVGAGWFEEEAQALGFMNPLTSNRFERLEDTLKLAKQMWADDQTPFKGKHYELPRPINRPQPVSKPHPPILIGGGGEQKTLRLVAQYADACNLFARVGSEELSRKLDVLKSHCKDIGRDYDEIEKSVLAGLDINTAANDPNAALEKLRELKQLGISHAIFSISKEYKPEAFKAFEEVAKSAKSL